MSLAGCVLRCVCSQTYTLCCGYVYGAGDKWQTLVHADLQVHHPKMQKTHISRFKSQQDLLTLHKEWKT